MGNPISWLLNVICCDNDKGGEIDDSNVDAVIARNLWKNHRILPPNSKFKQNWDLVMVCVALQHPCSDLRPGEDAVCLVHVRGCSCAQSRQISCGQVATAQQLHMCS